MMVIIILYVYIHITLLKYNKNSVKLKNIQKYKFKKVIISCIIITSYLSGKILNDSVSSILILSVVAISKQLTPYKSLVFLFSSVIHVIVCYNISRYIMC